MPSSLRPDETPRTVILLMKDPAEIQLLEQTASEFSHAAVIPPDEESLQQHLRTTNVVAVIVDFGCPSSAMSAVRICAHMRPGLPFIAVVPEEREVTVEALRMGAHTCIRRPLHSEEVTFSIGNLLSSVAERYNPLLSFTESRHVEITNDFDLVTPLARSIADTTLTPIDPRRNHVILGLIELLNNAIEHGNLEIGYEQKNEALKGSYFYRLTSDKSKQEPWASRRVILDASHDIASGWITYVIRDEGRGFDWKASPPPTVDNDGTESRHGRGILMARHSFEDMHYNDKGNEVTVRLRIRPEGGIS